MNRAINNLKLEAANVGKLKLLDELTGAYILAVQRLVNFLIVTGQRVQEKYGEIPGDEANLIGSPSSENQFSERWRRCAWQQARGIVKSWFANERINPPFLNVEDICIQVNANVVCKSPSSQQCLACGFVSTANPLTQAGFHDQHCHADCNASDVIAKGLGDQQLNALSVPRTGDLLLERFLERHQLLLRP